CKKLWSKSWPVYQSTPCRITAPNNASNTILKLDLWLKLSFKGFADVLPSVFNLEYKGDSFIFNRIYTETITNKMDNQNGYRQPPQSALNFSSLIFNLMSIMAPSAMNKPN